MAQTTRNHPPEDFDRPLVTAVAADAEAAVGWLAARSRWWARPDEDGALGRLVASETLGMRR